MDAFVHASGDGFGNTAPLRSDTGAIDMDAISQVAHVTQGAGKLTRKEKKHAKREMKRRKKEAKKAEKEAKKTYSSIKSQLKDRDKELSDKMADARKKRDSAKDVVNYIGYNKMYQDGICEVEEGMFSSSIAFDDTSYHSVRDEQQKAMFSAITRLYDQFGADTLVQMSVINTPLLKEEVGHRKFFDPERQANDAARNDAQVFNNILNDKVKEGVSNIRRNRYLTYSVTADTAEDAARQLSRIEVESSRILNSIGSKAHLMNGTQRLSVIHSLLNPYKPFLFDYQRDISAKRLQTTKDCIAPTQIDFRPDGHYNDCVKLDNGVYAQVLVMKKFGSELSDRALADMADLPIPMAITWYVQPMDKSKAINYVRTRSAWIDKEIIEEQRSAVNKGYDFSILPQELKYSKEETEDVLDHLQNKNQRLYVFTGLVYTYAESKEALDTQVLRIISTARQNSIELDTYDYRQRQGLNSILPLGHNHVEISRMFTTAQISILVPFATQELDDAGGNFYGQNKHSRNLVVCNRKKLTSPMGFVCGKTGSGKGMFTKTEMTGTIFSNPTDEIYVIDRAGEYTAIAERYGGSTYHFGVGTGTHLNPFDTVSVEHMTRNEQIAFKVDAMLAQAGASAAEAGSNFSEVDQSLVQRCTELAFQKAAERGDNLPPTLQDFYDAANEQPEEQAQVIALRYERFVKGSMNFFNHQSNVDFNTRIVDFNLKDLPDSMLVFALINVCEAVRNRMYFNASAIRVPRTQAVANPSAAIFVPSGRYGALMFIRDAARIPTMPPRKPRKKKPAFCPLVSARSIVISIWSFPASLEYICPIPSFFFAKPGHGAFAPVPAPRPAGILPSSARYGTICSGMPSSRKEEPWLPFKISRSVSRNRRRNSPNSKRRKRNLKRRFASGTGSGALWSPIPLVKVCSPPSVALGRNSTSTHSTDSLRAMQTR